jgi:hypothetical protein
MGAEEVIPPSERLRPVSALMDKFGMLPHDGSAVARGNLDEDGDIAIQDELLAPM